MEAIHWKPAITWVIDAIHVLRPIRFQSIRRNEVGHKIQEGKVKTAMKRGSLEGLHLAVDEDRQQRASTLLVDVAYVIEAHFDFTSSKGAEDTPGKHLDIFHRRAQGPMFSSTLFGNARISSTVFLLEPEDSIPPAISETRDLGFMLWDINHAGDRASMFFRAKLDAGVVRVPAPNSSEICR